MPPSLHVQTIEQMMNAHGFQLDEADEWVIRYRHHAFYYNALRAPDQLQQRAAWALAQIFVISDRDNGFNDQRTNPNGVPQWLGPSDYYDKLLQGVTGNYRDILRDVTLHPIMGHYLSHFRNAKADPSNNIFPDENYAREIMQLFSIGLHELHADGRPKLDENGNLIPTYDNDTIQNFARVFTGLTFAGAEYFYWGEPQDFVSPMEMWEAFHDHEEKTLLRGEVLPARLGMEGDGMADIEAALDNIAAHENVGPFIARQLIQRLVRSNPSRAYIRRVSRVFNSGPNGERGNMKAVIKAIMLDPEVFRGVRVRRLSNPVRVQVLTRGTEYSRMQEPMLRYISAIRALEPTATYQNVESPWVFMARTDGNFGQSPFGSPSVFNFYLPTYQPPGPLGTYSGTRRLPDSRIVAPEFQLLTTVMGNRMANHIRWEIYNSGGRYDFWSRQGASYRMQLHFNYRDWEQRIEEEPEAVIDELNWLLCRGTMEDASKQSILDALESVRQQYSWISAHEQFTAALTCVVSTPEFVITQ